jgi:hypothetical protein
VSGRAEYELYAPAADTLTGTVPATENDNFTVPAGNSTTGSWPKQAFSSPADVTIAYAGGGNDWSWAYSRACESWTDSGSNGDGNITADGNITGRACLVPHLFGGSAAYWAPTREYVNFQVTLPTWVMFTITGPGPINGHHGFVLAKTGQLNTGFYWGLLAHHDYTVRYWVVTGVNGHQVPGSQPGYVVFVS